MSRYGGYGTKGKRPEDLRGGVIEIEDPDDRVQSPTTFRPDKLRRDLIQDLRSRKGRESDRANQAFYDALLRAVQQKDLGVPPFPTTALKLDELIRKDKEATGRLTTLVDKDPALVKAVWAAARKVADDKQPKTLEQAIKLLGLDRLWKISFRITTESPVFRVRGHEEKSDEIRTHGILVARIAGWMGDHGRGVHYISGLLHDVGQLVILHAAGKTRGVRRPEVELVNNLIDQHHTALGLLIGRVWRLPKSVSMGLGFHHHPGAAPSDYRGLCKILQAADLAAHAASERRRRATPVAETALRNVRGLPLPHKDILERAMRLDQVIRGEHRAA